jgi:hypothetical protein
VPEECRRGGFIEFNAEKIGFHKKMKGCLGGERNSNVAVIV